MINESENIRTIEAVLNLDTGEKIYANILFDSKDNDHIIFPYREKCQDAYKKKREPFLVCEVCGQMVQISGGKGTKGKIKYFKHLKDSKDCPIKTDTKLSREDILRGKFNGQQEGALHIETKQLIYNFLCLNKDSKGEVSFAQPEMVNKSERDYLKWKKPDVTSVFKDKKLVFEIQLATTFLDVICERQYFYKENQSFIIWVFKNFEIEADKQRFTQKDIFYSNNRNAFVLDDEAIRLSNLHDDLFLLCQYQNPKEKDEKIVYEWEYKYVNLSDLTFDITSHKVYYYDVGKSEDEVKLDIENKISKREEAERLIKEKQEKLRLQKIEIRKEAQELIEIEKEKLRSQEIERLKQQEKNKSERQKVLDEEKKVFINLNASFNERLQSYQNLTPLQKIFKEDLHELNEKLKNLFVYGYSANQDDKAFLKREYELELKNKKDNNRLDILYFLALSIFYIKLSDTSRNYDYFSKIERVLFAILSIKEKRNIGYNFKTLVEIPNLFFNPKDKSKIEFSGVILEAINVYYGLDRFLSIEDSKGNFKRKLKDFLILRPNQEVNYNQFIKKVFKDLKI